MKPRSILPCLLLLLATTVNGQTPPATPLLAGASRADITPHEPVPMWGYGARHDTLSNGTLDSLFADAVVLQFGNEKLALVGLDLGRSPSEAALQHIRERIRSEAGIRYSFIAGSHTHHGPVLELTNEPGKGQGRFDAALRYYQELEDNIVAAILEADRLRRPARIATGSTNLTGFNRNRHTKFEPKPVDRELAVMRIDDLTGKSIATIINFAAHPTTLPAEMLKFSADYVGTLKREVEKSLGGRALFFNGAAGDQSVDQTEHKGPTLFGEALAREVIRLAREVRPVETTRTSLSVIEERFPFQSRTDLANPVVRSLYQKAFFPELIPNFIDEYANGIRPRLTVALLNGEIAIVGVSGEFFSNHSIRLRERARVRQLFFLGYCNGYHQYFPTIEAAAEGGYGADNQVAPAQVGAGEQIMNTALQWIYRLLGNRI
ncbi:MAG: neutral/alkaline non-lysosomal ceramidase N-terminal domain-containing protein [Blastocatellia bacterium]